MNILFVTQFFYPENFRINDLAASLVKRGHSVTVLTGQPNYPKGDFYEGYSAFSPKEESWEGVRILRVPVIPRKRGSFFLCLNYLSFVVFGCIGAMKLPKDFEAIYAFGTSPITQALPAITYKKRKKSCKLVLNVQDLWPDNVVAITGISNSYVVKLIDKLVDYIYNRCDFVLGTSHSFVTAIKSRVGLINKDKVKYYPQYSVVGRSEQYREDILPSDELHVVFTGNVGEGQGLDLLVEAARLIKRDGLVARDGRKLVFDIIGDGRAKEELMKKADGLDIVRFHGSFPENEIPAILNTADIGLLILKPNPIFDKTIPAKLQTYLACACPVLGCVNGEARQLILDNKIGICSDTVDADALYEAIKTVANFSKEELIEMGERAFTLSKKEFDKEMLVKQIENYMK